MSEPDPNRRGRLVLVAFGVAAAILIVAAITSNLNVWRQNDAFDARIEAETQ